MGQSGNTRELLGWGEKCTVTHLFHKTALVGVGQLPTPPILYGDDGVIAFLGKAVSFQN